ncbi:hypothetical protein ACGFIR_11540 [Micromonospora sp. NPDC049051]|uniref:hypothetical protein n=1 Tax=unclassified Micromonospora TaxID=2617518 RepID=UPI003719BC52
MAPILPERSEWTVDDLGDLPKDLFVTERPWKVSVDLPALTTRRAGLLARDEG